MNTHEVLVAARNLIDRDGWWQFSADGRAGECAVTSLSECGGFPSENPAFGEFKRALGVDSVLAITRWNDAPNRTKAEVLAAFDKAIAATAPLPPNLDLSLPAHLDPEPVPFP